jgi:GNAT superfamily N-acetyltransferase
MIDRLAIRETKRSDLNEILKLYVRAGIDDGNALSLSEAEHIFDAMKRYPHYKVYVSVLDRRIVGTFAILIMDNLAHLGAPSAIIEQVAVDPALQRSGIGKAMMTFALDLAKEHGCYKAMLSSNLKREAAHKFYESLGFKPHGYSYAVDI